MRLLHACDTQAAHLTFQKVDEHAETFVELVDTLRGGGSGMPTLSCSDCAYPAPSPSSRRPSVSRSTVAACRARSPGLWNALLTTSGPTRNVVVASAALTRGRNGSAMP